MEKWAESLQESELREDLNNVFWIWKDPWTDELKQLWLPLHNQVSQDSHMENELACKPTLKDLQAFGF